MVENIIYGVENENIYTLPVFIEDISFKSTFYPEFIDNEHNIEFVFYDVECVEITE